MPSATANLTAIVTTHLRPVLRERGFTGSGATFRRPVEAGTQVVHVQRGRGNNAQAAIFYLNGGVYLAALDAAIGRPVVAEPDEPSCQVRMRPPDLDPTLRPEYPVSPEVGDTDTIGAEAARDLRTVLDALDRLSTPAAAIDHLAGRYLAQFEIVFGWLLAHGEVDRARAFTVGLHERFGHERRWSIIAERLDEVARDVHHDASWRTWTGDPGSERP